MAIATSLRPRGPRRVGQRAVEAPHEPDDCEIGKVGEHQREVRAVEGRQQGEASPAQAPEAGQLDVAVARQALAGTAHFEHADADRALDGDTQHAEQPERPSCRAPDARWAEDAAADDHDIVVRGLLAP